MVQAAVVVRLSNGAQAFINETSINGEADINRADAGSLLDTMFNASNAPSKLISDVDIARMESSPATSSYGVTSAAT